eukprot:7149771-Karenia_brevis.AAC.1
MTAVMRALLAVEQYDQVAHTLKSMLVIDWEEIWDRADAIIARGTRVEIKKVKAHTIDEALASKEQQAGNWLADSFADKGALACQLNEAETKPILKKDR